MNYKLLLSIRFLKTRKLICFMLLFGMSPFTESCKKSSTTTSNQEPQGPTVNFTLNLTQPSNANLGTAGGTVASNGVLIVYTGSSYVAVAQNCTHATCNIGYSPSDNDFICPCCGGTYDINGNVVTAPPTIPIKKYTVTKSGNNLTIAG